MNRIVALVVALLAGFVSFVVTGVLATELFFPRIEFSLFVGIPFGAWTGIAVAGLVFAGLWYRDEPSPRSLPVVVTTWTTLAVFLAYALVSVVGFAWYFLLDGNLAVILLIYGLPAAMVLAGVVGLLAAVVRADRQGGRPSPQ